MAEVWQRPGRRQRGGAAARAARSRSARARTRAAPRRRPPAMGRLSHEGAAAPTPPPPGEPLAAAPFFKGTTLPHVVVRRGVALYAGAFATHQAERPPAAGKLWPLHRRCGLDPPDARGVRAHERHLRKAGPLRAVAAYARDKNMLKLVRRCVCVRS